MNSKSIILPVEEENENRVDDDAPPTNEDQNLAFLNLGKEKKINLHKEFDAKLKESNQHAVWTPNAIADRDLLAGILENHKRITSAQENKSRAGSPAPQNPGSPIAQKPVSKAESRAGSVACSIESQGSKRKQGITNLLSTSPGQLAAESTISLNSNL